MDGSEIVKLESGNTARMVTNKRSGADAGIAKQLLRRAARLALASQGAGNLDKALVLIERSAKLGNAEAEYAIGTWYLFGRKLPKDPAKAARHFAIAVRGGHSEAMYDLAVLYETGRGVKKNSERAFDLYVKAARKNDSDAIRSVVRCLFHGIGTARNRHAAELIADYSEGLIRAPRRTEKLPKN